MLQEYWHIGCATAQLKDVPLATQMLNEKIVLFRDSQGKAHALKDRCCHRGLPLSKGKIKGDAIVCGFHGWEYGGDGKCVRLPSQPADTPIAKVYCVPSFTCSEKDGYVWIWSGSGTPSDLPSIPEFEGHKWLQGSAVVKCNFLRALEITYDGAHVYFVHATHPATIAAAKSGFAEGKGEVRITDQGCIAFGPATRSEDEPIPNHAMSMEFVLPGRIRFFTPAMGTIYYMYFHVTPIGERQCRIDWLISNPNPSAQAVTFIPHSDFLQEDVDILEAIQATYDTEGDGFERSVEADNGVLTLRKIVKLAMSGHWCGTKSDIPLRKVYAQMGPASFG